MLRAAMAAQPPRAAARPARSLPPRKWTTSVATQTKESGVGGVRATQGRAYFI